MFLLRLGHTLVFLSSGVGDGGGNAPLKSFDLSKNLGKEVSTFFKNTNEIVFFCYPVYK